MPKHFAYYRATEQLERHRCRDGIAGESQQWHTAYMTKCNRFARPHVDTPEVDLPLFCHDVLHQVKIADRNSARGNDQIIFYRLGELLTQVFSGVLGYTQPMSFSARLPDGCFKEITIAVAYFSWL